MTELIESATQHGRLSREGEGRLDAVLRPLTADLDEQAKREVLERLLIHVAAPVMKSVLRRKIGEIGSGRRFRAEDEEDIAAAAMLRLIRRLSQDLNLHPIERFQEYVAGVASHAFNDHLRSGDPERTNLSAAIVRALRGDPRFGIWSDDAQIVGGCVAWHGQKAVAVNSDTLRGRFSSGPGVAEALASIFQFVGAPVALPCLTAILAPALASALQVSGEAVAQLSAVEPVPWRELHSQRTARVVWREIQLLPLEQRLAVLLHLRDEWHSTALRFFPIAGVATLGDIAVAMGIDERALAELWRELPMPDSRIAERLGIPRQRVINLRSSARKRLARRLRKEGL